MKDGKNTLWKKNEKPIKCYDNDILYKWQDGNKIEINEVLT